jgi:hypothetical protein
MTRDFSTPECSAITDFSIFHSFSNPVTWSWSTTPKSVRRDWSVCEGGAAVGSSCSFYARSRMAIGKLWLGRLEDFALGLDSTFRV